jgi:hypothetical protein
MERFDGRFHVACGYAIHSRTSPRVDRTPAGFEVWSIDTGCLGGGCLTALVLDHDRPSHREVVQVSAARESPVVRFSDPHRVRSDARPRYAIREALGQLREYAFACEKNGEPVTQMIVAGPGEVGPRDQEYLEHLRVRRGLPVRYVCVRRGMDRVDI